VPAFGGELMSRGQEYVREMMDAIVYLPSLPPSPSSTAITMCARASMAIGGGRSRGCPDPGH